MKMKYTPKTIQLDEIIMGQNVRLPQNLKIEGLREDIEERGLTDPITVVERDGGKFEVVKGHRRRTAIGQIRESSPKTFEKLFAKGVPCFLLSGVTEDEIRELKVDHGTEEGLSDPYEVQMCANMLFDAGKTEAEVAIQLNGLISKIAPMKLKPRQELESLKARKQEAEDKGLVTEAAVLDRDIKELISQYRRGYVQNLHNAYRSPDMVMAALYAKASGEKPEGYEETDLPPLTTSAVTKLFKAFKKDLEIVEDGVPRYNKGRPGPHFTELWDKLIEDGKDGKRTSEPKPKSMSAKAIGEDIAEGKYRSIVSIKVARRCAGEKEIEGIPEADLNAHYGELVAEHCPDLWAKLVEKAKEIEAELVAADKEAATESDEG